MADEQDDPTKDELYEKAQELDIDGRSTMDKAELEAAVAAAEANGDGESDGDGESEADASVDTQAATAPDPDTERKGDYHPQGAGEGEDADAIGDIPRPDGETIAGDTDTDPVLDSEADYSKPEVEYHADTNEVKSIQEEEEAQHERRKAADAKIEEAIKNAGTTPF